MRIEQEKDRPNIYVNLPGSKEIVVMPPRMVVFDAFSVT
jgi:hypothetical protein